MLEFVANLWLAPRRLRFLRRHWLQAAAVVLPTLRLFRFLRLLRLGRALPAARVVGRITMLTGFLFGLVVVAFLAGTVGAFLVEERRERAEREREAGA